MNISFPATFPLLLPALRAVNSHQDMLQGRLLPQRLTDLSQCLADGPVILVDPRFDQPKMDNMKVAPTKIWRHDQPTGQSSQEELYFFYSNFIYNIYI